MSGDAPRDEIPEAATPDCNGEPHLYAYKHGAHSPVSVGRCMVCGALALEHWATVHTIEGDEK